MLNNAIETLHSSVPVDKWSHVNVTVAPSSITISDHEVVFFVVFFLLHTDCFSIQEDVCVSYLRYVVYFMFISKWSSLANWFGGCTGGYEYSYFRNCLTFQTEGW